LVNLPIEYSDKPVSPYGGMSLMKRFLDQTGIKDFQNFNVAVKEVENKIVRPLHGKFLKKTIFNHLIINELILF
jgi:hypothetical protein